MNPETLRMYLERGGAAPDDLPNDGFDSKNPGTRHSNLVRRTGTAPQERAAPTDPANKRLGCTVASESPPTKLFRGLAQLGTRGAVPDSGNLETPRMHLERGLAQLRLSNGGFNFDQFRRPIWTR